MTSNHQAFEDLIKLLEEESEIYGEMGELLEAEQDALRRLAAPELGEITARKETLALRVKDLDESRKVMSEGLGRRLEIAPEELTVTALCERAPASASRRLHQVRTTLRDRASACKAINDYNSRAARRGLDLVSGAIGYLLQDADPTGKVYKKKGGYGQASRHVRPAMVSQEV